MSQQNLRDSRGRPIGSIRTGANGRDELRDQHGGRLGSYDPRSNKTYDARGSLVGTGNQLSSFLSRR
jgi:hypothetical protein